MSDKRQRDLGITKPRRKMSQAEKRHRAWLRQEAARERAAARAPPPQERKADVPPQQAEPEEPSGSDVEEIDNMPPRQDPLHISSLAVGLLGTHAADLTAALQGGDVPPPKPRIVPVRDIAPDLVRVYVTRLFAGMTLLKPRTFWLEHGKYFADLVEGYRTQSHRLVHGHSPPAAAGGGSSAGAAPDAVVSNVGTVERARVMVPAKPPVKTAELEVQTDIDQAAFEALVAEKTQLEKLLLTRTAAVEPLRARVKELEATALAHQCEPTEPLHAKIALLEAECATLRRQCAVADASYTSLDEFTKRLQAQAEELRAHIKQLEEHRCPPQLQAPVQWRDDAAMADESPSSADDASTVAQASEDEKQPLPLTETEHIDIEVRPVVLRFIEQHRLRTLRRAFAALRPVRAPVPRAASGSPLLAEAKDIGGAAAAPEDGGEKRKADLPPAREPPAKRQKLSAEERKARAIAASFKKLEALRAENEKLAAIHSKAPAAARRR